MGATYLNTDLMLKARFNLKPLCGALASGGLFELGEPRVRGGVWSATLETSLARGTPEKALERFLDVIDDLNGNHRRDWDRCLHREFDIGFEASTDRFEDHWKVNAGLLERIVAAGASLAVTIYTNPPRR